MDLRDFIRTTMLSLHDAIVDIEENEGGKYEVGADVKRKSGIDNGTIHFDIAVVAGNESEKTGGGKAKASIRVLSAEGGGSSTKKTKDENTTRISFDLVLQNVQRRNHSKQG